MEKIYQTYQGNVYVECGELNDNLEDKLGNIKNGFIVCWLDYSVLFGKIDGKDLKLYGINDFNKCSKYLLRLKAFNQDEELHVWKTADVFKYRYIKDKVGNKFAEYIDAKQVMLGTKFKYVGNFVEVSESSGIKYFVPREFIHNNINENSWMILYTRNYIDYNEIGQAGFVDNRFLKIEMVEVWNYE